MTMFEIVTIWAAIATVMIALVSITLAFSGGIKGILKIGRWIKTREAFEQAFTETLAELRGDIAELRQEVRGTTTELRQELRETTAELRKELSETTASLRKELSETTASLRKELSETTAELRQELSGTTAELRQDVRELRGVTATMGYQITQIFKTLPSDSSAGESPLKLTELGKSISKEVGGAAWAEEEACNLSRQVEGKPPYAIHDFSIDVVFEDQYDPPEEFVEAMKAAAYNHGVTIIDVKKALAIELRDALLRSHGMEPPGSA